MISCLLLAAGLSRRFGSPKALALIDQKPVIEWIQEELLLSQVDEIMIVLGAFHDQIKPHLFNHRKVQFVYNKDYISGQTSSIKAGLKGISKQSEGVFVLPVDYPFVKASTIDLLMEDFLEKRPFILIPTHKDKKGHPPLLSMLGKSEILGLADEIGLNVFEHQYAAQTRLIPVEDGGVVSSFNTVEEFEKLIHMRRP